MTWQPWDFSQYHSHNVVPLVVCILSLNKQNPNRGVSWSNGCVVMYSSIFMKSDFGLSEPKCRTKKESFGHWNRSINWDTRSQRNRHFTPTMITDTVSRTLLIYPTHCTNRTRSDHDLGTIGSDVNFIISRQVVKGRVSVKKNDRSYIRLKEKP